VSVYEGSEKSKKSFEKVTKVKSSYPQQWFTVYGKIDLEDKFDKLNE
jgi:hypothetical protein